MVERIHVPFEARKEAVEQIKTITSNLREIVTTMNATPTIRAAYMNSVLNLEKKNELYGTEKEKIKLTPEEKEIARKAVEAFRAGKTEVSEISPDESVDEEKPRKKGRHN